jgi:HAE1 family hydrophobic/amphiphilic exporter-1
MTLSDVSIKNPVFAWMIMGALIIFGGISFYRMGISQLPDVDFPVVSVNLRLEGAAPDVIETEIVDYVEDAVMGIEGVKNVTSRSENSEATISIEFELNRNIDVALSDVQAKVAQVQSKLPKDVTAISISKTNPEDQPIMLLTLESDKYSLRDLMVYTNDRLKDQFAMVSGVGNINLRGYVDPNLRIWVSGDKIKKYQLTVDDVIAAVQNEHSEQPAGQVNNEAGNRMFYVRTMGEATSVDQFNNILINHRGGQPNYQPLHLGQVARVEEGLADVLGYSRANQVPGVGIGILKQRGSNAVAVAKAVRVKVAEIQKGLPEGMNLGINYDSTRFIELAVGELNFTLLLSALLTALVCWWFLGSWSSTLNVLLSIPTSIVGTFIFLYFAGFTLNTFTLLGLSLSIGIVVDDAIIVLENIIRHQEKGKDRVQAAIFGAREITFAAMAATLSIVAIFLPVVFMTGIIGRYFFQFGVTITVAVSLSLLEALTLTPMRCSQFVDRQERTTRLGRMMESLLAGATRLYTAVLAKTLDFPWTVVLLSLVLFGASFSTIRFLNREFLPAEDQGQFNIRLKTPIGSSLAYSDSRFKEVEKFLAARPEVSRYVLQVGGGSPGDAYSGSVLVSLKDKGKRGIDPEAGHELTQAELMDVCRKGFKKMEDVKASLQDPSTRNFAVSRGFPVEFGVQGPEWDQLASLTKRMMEELDKSGMVTDLDNNYSEAMPEFHVVPDREKAALYGVSIASISETVNAMIGGEVVGQYPQGGHRYDITVKVEEAKGDPIEKLKALYVRNNRGELVHLSDLVTIEEKSSMVEIDRLNRERTISVYANVKTGASQARALQEVEAIAKRILPPQYHIVFSGSSQAFSESFQSLIVALCLGLLVAYMVLASQFNSFIDPFVVLMALPFSFSGAFVALYLGHQSINIYSLIGLILLMGIVKKNSILLVDYTNKTRARGEPTVKGALLKACPVRLRPILMTSVATVAGAIPVALSLGPGAESRIPMAVSIIGGVAVSTLLTLLVVPNVYVLLSRLHKNRTFHVDESDEI